jgi:hypothetical protein
MVDVHDLLEQFLFEHSFELLQGQEQQLYQQEVVYEEIQEHDT